MQWNSSKRNTVRHSTARHSSGMATNMDEKGSYDKIYSPRTLSLVFIQIIAYTFSGTKSGVANIG